MSEPVRPILELATAELYSLAEELYGSELPPLEAVENEDWGRDYLLQCLRQVPPAELAARGFTWEEERT